MSDKLEQAITRIKSGDKEEGRQLLIEALKVAVIDINDIESIKERIYALLNIKRIFYMRHGEIQGKPIVFSADQEVTVSDFIKNLDKRLLEGFKRARIIHGDSMTPREPTVGLDYELHDGDTVELVSP